MDYAKRLIAAAQFILESDGRHASAPPSTLADPTKYRVTATLKPHQIEGVSWLLSRYDLGVNVILGDEMGLGKTLQAIALLSYLKFHNKTPGPFLVLCPLSVTDGWMSEFSKFCPSMNVLCYVGDKGHRRDLRKIMHEHVHRQPKSNGVQLELPFDVLLTTYDIAILDQDFLSQIPWHYTVIDEAQRLKNPSSVLYDVLEHQFIMPRRLLMTGTPIQNNLSELWALMHFCMPLIFGTIEQFISTFKEAGSSSTGHNADKVKRQFQILKYVLKAFMLRRTKASLVESGSLILPPLTEITVMVPLVPLQKNVYMSILRRELPALLSLASTSSSHQSLNNIVIHLRKACSHPYLFSGIEPEPYEEGEHLVEASGKLIVLDHLLRKLHADGHRVLLFAQMTHTLDILQDFLELRKYTYERLDGSVRAEERFAAIRNFSSQPVKNTTSSQSNNDNAFVFMISTRAGGVGLNLVAADTVIFYEQDWNPQVDKQALQRAHRIGQMNHVLSINLVTERTIDEIIMRRADRKLQLSNNVVGQENEIHGSGKENETEDNTMRSLIFGLRSFDPEDMNAEEKSWENKELDRMAEKVVNLRNVQQHEKDGSKFEINSKSLLSKKDLVSFDPELDDASYRSWVEKFKDESKHNETSELVLDRRNHVLEDRSVKREAAKKKAEEKRLAKWEAEGYHSLNVKEPDVINHDVLLSDNSGSVHYVYGDCTKPEKTCPSKPAIIFSCVDNSGNWGHGGMFDALTSLSTHIAEAYHKAFECDDLHLGDLHLIKLNDTDPDSSKWVALAVVQSYNARRKVPRSNISISNLEQCLSKASYSAAQVSASIHMPRIGYGSNNGSQRSEWYAVERLLRKYASIHGIDIFVYYFRRPSQ